MEILSNIPEQSPAQAVVLLIKENGEIPSFWPQELGAQAAALRTFAPKICKSGTVTLIPNPAEERWLVLSGLGKDESTAALRDRCAEAVRKLMDLKVQRVDLWLPEEAGFETSIAAAEGIKLGSYRFDAHKKSSQDCGGQWQIRFNGNQEGLRTGAILADAQIQARDLANEPGNVIGPLELANAARRVAARSGLECRIYDDREILDMAMRALWSVGQGSARKPRLVHMVYRPEHPRLPLRRVVFVGKAVTFDSGGLSLKSHNGMLSMKSDKTGACNVIAIMEAVSQLKPDLEVHGIFGAVENMPDGRAYRPDDIIKAKNGKTIEIKNTDAEGRVTLADTLAYACEQSPDLLIDMATLTGAAATALGNYTAAALGDDEKAASALINAGKAEGERFHHFTLDDQELRRQIDSPFADVKNSGGPGGGAITAAMFLREFVTPGLPWVHLDIAGVDFYDRAFGCYSEGCSAFGVRTCLRLLLEY